MFIIVKLFSFFRSHAYVQIGKIIKAIEKDFTYRKLPEYILQGVTRPEF